MAGAGYKLFNTGDVLTAAQVNTYLQEQAVMRFASAAARTTALSGVLAEGMMSYLDDTNSVEVYDGSAWVSVGSTGDITGVTAGTGISGGGTSGTVTITNDMATTITAAGDIVVGTGSGTYDNLPIGTTGQVLTADTTVSPYKVKWAAGSSGGLVLINRTSYSNVASQTFDNVFSTTYKFYTIAIEQNYAASANDDFEMIMRYGTTDASNHYSLCNYYAFNSSTLGQLSVSAGAAMKLSPDAGDISFRTSLNLTVGWVGTGSNSFPLVYGTGYSNNGSHSLWFGGYPYVGSQQYTGFKLRSSSTNITGTVSVYGWSAS